MGTGYVRHPWSGCWWLRTASVEWMFVGSECFGLLVPWAVVFLAFVCCVGCWGCWFVVDRLAVSGCVVLVVLNRC